MKRILPLEGRVNSSVCRKIIPKPRGRPWLKREGNDPWKEGCVTEYQVGIGAEKGESGTSDEYKGV